MPLHNGGTIRRRKIGCYYQRTFVCICSIFKVDPMPPHNGGTIRKRKIDYCLATDL